MPSVFDRFLFSVWPELGALRAEVNALKGQVEAVMVDQKQVDEKFDALTAAISGIRTDIDALKAANPPGTVMSEENFAKLSAIADAAAALDGENPAAATT